jgi:hypothetical protein
MMMDAEGGKAGRKSAIGSTGIFNPLRREISFFPHCADPFCVSDSSPKAPVLRNRYKRHHPALPSETRFETGENEKQSHWRNEFMRVAFS